MDLSNPATQTATTPLFDSPSFTGIKSTSAHNKWNTRNGREKWLHACADWRNQLASQLGVNDHNPKYSNNLAMHYNNLDTVQVHPL